MLMTSAFELEVGAADIDAWYRDREPGRAINYGVSVGHIPVRIAVMHDPSTFLPSGDAAHKAASPAEIAEMARRIDEGLRKGAGAMGLGPSYTAAATQWEVLEMFRVAGRHHASVHVHIRGGMAGLASGALLAKQGRRVVVLRAPRTTLERGQSGPREAAGATAAASAAPRSRAGAPGPGPAWSC